MLIVLLLLTVAVPVVGFWAAMLLDVRRHKDEKGRHTSPVSGPVAATSYFFERVARRQLPAGRSSKGIRAGAMLNAAYHAFLVIFVLGVWFFLMPWLVGRCEELGMQEPLLARQTRGFCEAMQWWPRAAIALAVGVAMIWSDALLYYYLRREKGRVWAYLYSGLYSLVLAGLVGFTVAAIWLTYVAALNAVSNG